MNIYESKNKIASWLCLQTTTNLKVNDVGLIKFNQPRVKTTLENDNALIRIIHSRYDDFYLAYALREIYMIETKMNIILSEIGSVNFCLAFALAYCECINSSSEGADVKIPYSFIRKELRRLLPKNKRLVLDDSGVPVETRALADEIKKTYSEMI